MSMLRMLLEVAKSVEGSERSAPPVLPPPVAPNSTLVRSYVEQRYHGRMSRPQADRAILRHMPDAAAEFLRSLDNDEIAAFRRLIKQHGSQIIGRVLRNRAMLSLPDTGIPASAWDRPRVTA